MTLLSKFAAILKRDLLTLLRYRLGLAAYIITALGELAGYFYLARAVGPDFRPDGYEYFSFLLLGTAVYGFLLIAIQSFVSTIRESQLTGTLEVLTTSSTSAPVLVTLSSISTTLGASARTVLYLGLAVLLFGIRFPHANLLAAAIVAGLGLAIALAIGILAAAVQVELQRGGAVVAALAAVFALLTGMMFPVAALPAALQTISQAIPMTHVLSGLRMALLGGAGPAELAGQLAVLAAFAAALIPLGLGAFSLAMRRARRHGTLSYY